MKKSIRISWPIRVILGIIIVLLALYGSAVVLLRTQWFQSELHHYIVESLERLTGARVQVGAVSIQPFIFQVTLKGLVLHGTEAPTQPPLFTARRLVVDINPASVLRGKLLLTRFAGVGLEAHLWTYRDGSTNLPGPRHPAGSAVDELMNLSIGTLNLQNTNLFWNNQKIPLGLTARNVAMLLRYSAGRGYWGAFSSSPIQLASGRSTFPPLTVATRLGFSRKALDLKDLVWRSPGLTGKGEVNLQWQPTLQGWAKFQTRGSIRRLTDTLHLTPVKAGEFQMECQATYREGKFQARGRMRAEGVDVQTPEFALGTANLVSNFAVDQKYVRFTNLHVQSLGGTLEGEMTVELQGKAPIFRMRGQVGDIDLAKALQVVSGWREFGKLVPVVSKVSGPVEASWNGTLHNFKSNFDLQFTAPMNPSPGLLPLTGTARGSAALAAALTVSLEQAELMTPHASFTAQGTLGGASSALNVNYSTTNFQEIEPLIKHIAGLSESVPLELKSTATFKGLVTGSVERPSVQGHLSIGAFDYGGWSWQNFAADLATSPQRFQVSSGKLRSGPSFLDFSGFVELANWKVSQHSAIQLMAQAQRSPLQGLENAFKAHYPITGVVTGGLKLAGTPASLEGSGNFQISNGAIEQEPFNSLSGKVMISGSVWNFQDILLRKGHGSLTGWARVDLPKHSFSTDLRGTHFSLAEFNRLKLRQPEEADEGEATPIQGIADLHLQGSGTFTQPQVASTLNIEGLTLEDVRLGDLKAQLALKGKQLQGVSRLQGPGGTVRIDLKSSLEGDWISQLSGKFSNFRLDPWFDWLGHYNLQTPVIVSGTFKGTVPLKKPREMSMEAQAQKLEVALPGFDLKNTQPVGIRYAAHSLHSTHFAMQGPSTNLGIQLAARLGPAPTVSLDAMGNADASVLKLIDPSIQATGGVGINFHATGALAQPSLSGQITVHSLSMRYASLPLPIAGLNGTIVLKGNRATIESLGAQSGQTSIQLSGYATIGSVPRFNLRAAFQRIRLEYPTDFTSLLSGDLNLTGSSQAGQLTGDITVGQMFVSENFNLVNWLGEMGAPSNGVEATTEPSIPSKVRLDIHVVTNPEVRVSSRALTLEASMNMNVRGTLANPVVMGNIHIRNGQAVIAGNRYDITRGDITMTSPFQTTPVLDIEAETRVERYNIIVDVTGPVDRPKLAYRSDPPLPSEDVLSLLALGYAPQQALMRSSGNEPFGAIGASALLSQALSSQVSGRVQRLFGVSRIRIDPNLLGPTTAGGARVTIEEQVSRDLTITYSTNTAAAQQRDIRVRWDISNKISLIGERDINGVFGFEVRFHRRLK
jgi:translocation and assembly module TamB